MTTTTAERPGPKCKRCGGRTVEFPARPDKDDELPGLMVRECRACGSKGHIRRAAPKDN